jgi:translation initiation factor IF-2
MRKRGANITDVAILVVAADDGVMPQTIEAINHARAANVPIIVAINKIDLPTANIEKVTNELMEQNLIPEQYGGKTMFVQISAKEKKGINELLDAVLLTADAELDLTTTRAVNVRGTVIEARKLKGKGITATILVQNYDLAVGDKVVVGTSYGYIRAIIDEFGNSINRAKPSQPVIVLGLSRAPHAGDMLIETTDIQIARQVAEKRLHNYRAEQFMRTTKRITLENINQEIAEGNVNHLDLIIKSESSGNLEALENAITQIDIGTNEVGINIIHHGVGDISQNDVNLASADGAIIIAFNVDLAQKLDVEDVDIRKYSVIYDVTNDIESALKGMLKPVEVEVVYGRAEIQQIFKSSKFGIIAGSLVKSGFIKRQAKARIFSDATDKATIIDENILIDSLKRFKDDATEVKEGFECGIGLSGYNKELVVGNIIECYGIEKQT